MIRRMRMAGFALLGLLVLAAAVGAGYEAIAAHEEARRFPEPGRPIETGGLSLQLHCAGSGSPTVILESGLGGLLGEWKAVQSEVARFTRVCSYDRAGYGASEAGPMPRTSARIAGELDRLLRTAREAPPFVLVGHSFGGYNVRVFAGKHLKDVEGVVLVDATQEDQYRLLPETWKALGAEMRERFRYQARWAPVTVGLGYYRAVFRLNGIPGPYRILSTKYLRARASELEEIEISGRQAREAGLLGDVPLVVLTAGKPADTALRNGLGAREVERFQQTWIHELQPRLARLSTRGRQVVVPDSGHNMTFERPDAIVRAVRELCRSDAGLPFHPRP